MFLRILKVEHKNGNKWTVPSIYQILMILVKWKESLEHYQIYRSGNILFLFQTRFFFKHSFEGNRKKEFLQ